jgi:hypothetical protein
VFEVVVAGAGGDEVHHHCRRIARRLPIVRDAS